MFWESVIGGIFSLSYSQVWMAIILYAIVIFAFQLISSRAFESKYSGSVHILYLVVGPVLQGIMTAFVVAYLSPLILFGDSAAPISWIIANIWTICIIGIVSIIISIIISSIPIVNIIFQNPAAGGFLAGVIVFRFLFIDTQSNIYPGILESIGFLILSYYIGLLFTAVGYITLPLIFKKIMPSENDEDIEGWLTIVLFPLAGIASMLPVFMYISYVR